MHIESMQLSYFYISLNAFKKEAHVEVLFYCFSFLLYLNLIHLFLNACVYINSLIYFKDRFVIYKIWRERSLFFGKIKLNSCLKPT